MLSFPFPALHSCPIERAPAAGGGAVEDRPDILQAFWELFCRGRASAGAGADTQRCAVIRGGRREVSVRFFEKKLR